jgi:hypothetical protein
MLLLLLLLLLLGCSCSASLPPLVCQMAIWCVVCASTVEEPPPTV